MDNENEQVQTVLNYIDRRFLEIGRMFQQEQYENVLQVIHQIRRNLLRIRNRLSNSIFLTIQNSLDNLTVIVNREVSTIGVNRYRAAPIVTNQPGRPKLDITKEQLHFLINEKYTAVEMAQHFQCSKYLIYKKCYHFGLHFRSKYYNGSDSDLRDDIMSLHNQFPNSGSQMMAAYLHTRGKLVQRHKVRKILADIDPLGTACRWSNSIQRRLYSVPTPNSLWHMDAHLKLIRWKFAIHGCIDGYSRLIVYLKCNNSMTAGGVIPYFASAIAEYGVPSRMRSDHGYENFFVALLMNALRGLERGSHITGRSVHNQRIERLWADVYTQVVDKFYREFSFLENQGVLNLENNYHMFALHKVYSISINEKLSIFRDGWNTHSLRTVRKTPRQLWVSGMLANMNSSHTATTEVFNDQEDLYTRVVQAFESNDMYVNVMDLGDEVSQSSLTIQLPLSDNDSREIDAIVESSLEDKEKYLQLIAFLENV